MKRVAALFALGVLACTAPALHAQDTALDRVQNMIAAGRLTEARNTLAQWESSFADPRSDATPQDRARAMYLRGTLSSDAKEAEEAFIGVVLSHPSSAAAPAALLRLGQSLHTAGESRRALAYLERLRSDYPGARERDTGLLWLARVQLQLGSATSACASARAGADATTDVNLRVLFDIERERACTAVDNAAAATPPPADARAAMPPPTPPAATPPVPTVTTAPPPTPPVNAGTFAVQTAAFRELRSAETVAAQMREQGIDVRIVRVGDSPLHRLRVGSYTTFAEAAAAARRIHDAGFATIVVDDVRLEKR